MDERALAGIVRRGFATLIDLAFALAVGLFAQFLLRRLQSAGPDADSWLLGHPRLQWALCFAFPAWLALCVCEALPARAGPGKHLLGMRIEGPRLGEKVSFARIAVRNAIKLAPWLIGGLAFLFPTPWDPRESLERSRFAILLGSNLWIGIYLAAAAMTRRRQSLHDLATGTTVIMVREGRGPPLPSPTGDG